MHVVYTSGTQEIKTTNHLSSIFNQKYHSSFVIFKKYTSIHCRKMFKEQLSRVRFFNVSQKSIVEEPFQVSFLFIHIHIYISNGHH